MKRLSGWLLKLASVPLNRLITSGYTPGTINGDNDLVNITRLRATIIALMQRNGLVLIQTNTPLTGMGNTVTVDGTAYTLSERQRVLLTGQTDTAQNGFYEWTAAGGGTLTRLWDWRDITASQGVQLAGANLTDIRARVSNLSNNVLRLIGNDLAVTIDNTSPGTSPALKRDASGNLFIQNDLLPGASGSLSVFDEGTLLGVANSMDFVGSGVRATWDNALGRAVVKIGSTGVETIPWFGDGSDGDVTITSNTTLTRDMYYNNLTINAGITLNTNNFRVFVRNTMTLNGTIGAPGANATNNNATIGYAAKGTINALSGNGGAGWSVAAGGSIASNCLGGAGGKGGDGDIRLGEFGAAGGTITVPVDAAGGANCLKNAISAYLQRVFNVNTAVSLAGGAGGGSGYRAGGSTTNPGISGGAGGGGAAIFANSITGTGTISCRGGNGIGATSGTGGSRWGGGGGGGGGWVVVVTSTPYSAVNLAAGTANVGTCTITVQGGTGGIGFATSGTAQNGENGQPGRMFLFNV